MMELSFGELVVLASVRGPMDRNTLALYAARLYQSTKYDQALALAEIKNLEVRGFLKTRLGDMRVEITRDGWAATLQAIPVMEQLRAALGSVSYQAVR